MNSRLVSTVFFRRMRLALLFAIVGLILVPTLTFAAETRGGSTVVVGTGETIGDDLYVAGGTVMVLGTIDGDLVVVGGTVTVSGMVRGDVIAAGGTVNLQGPVGRNVRVVGGTVNVTNTVGRDVAAAGGTLNVEPPARVGRDLLTGAGSANVDGPVARNILADAGTVIINAPIGGDVQYNGSTLRLGSQASIGGNLTYTSDTQVVSPAVPVVKGRTAWQPRAAPTVQSPSARAVGDVVGWFRSLVGLFALGLVLVLTFPAFSRRTVTTLEQSPGASFVVGLISLILVPLAAIVVFAFGLVVGGWWLGLIALALYGIALVVSMPVAALYVGTTIADRVQIPKIQPVWALLLGTATILIVSLVPVVGAFVIFVALLFGLGSLLLAAYRTHTNPNVVVPSTNRVTRDSQPTLVA